MPCQYHPFSDEIYDRIVPKGFRKDRKISLKWVNEQFFGHKGKGQISKRVLHENRARQIFRKTNISYSLIRTFRFECRPFVFVPCDLFSFLDQMQKIMIADCFDFHVAGPWNFYIQFQYRNCCNFVLLISKLL